MGRFFIFPRPVFGTGLHLIVSIQALNPDLAFIWRNTVNTVWTLKSIGSRRLLHITFLHHGRMMWKYYLFLSTIFDLTQGWTGNLAYWTNAWWASIELSNPTLLWKSLVDQKYLFCPSPALLRRFCVSWFELQSNVESAEITWLLLKLWICQREQLTVARLPPFWTGRSAYQHLYSSLTTKTYSSR